VTITPRRHFRRFFAGIRMNSLDNRLRGHDGRRVDTHCGTLFASLSQGFGMEAVAPLERRPVTYAFKSLGERRFSIRSKTMHTDDPERMAHAVIAACADCDICRFLMEDTPCPVFPELYRLYDREKEKGGAPNRRELKDLVELCNFCALCPCPNIRRDIMKAKHAFVDRDGIGPAVRLLEDVERISKLCGAYPRLSNTLFQSRSAGRFLKRLAGIHEERKVPVFPGESFANRARKEGLHIMRRETRRKVAYFAGCTGQYLFPDVPAAGVRVLQRNGVEVYFPEQKCCGMPSLLEGDRRLTLEFASFNMERLSEAVAAGYDIVCSCPTCGYMLKNVLSEGAFYSDEHRQSAACDGSDCLSCRIQFNQMLPYKVCHPLEVLNESCAEAGR
jgi:Fe-S oxidoreductase